jgi:hypothetical protein
LKIGRRGIEEHPPVNLPSVAYGDIWKNTIYLKSYDAGKFYRSTYLEVIGRIIQPICPIWDLRQKCSVY